MFPYALSTDPRIRSYVQRARAERSEYMASLLRAGVARLAKTAAAFRQWRRRRRAIAELQGLDARILKDMGLSRGRIYAAVYGIDDPRRSPRKVAPSAAGGGMTVQDCINAAVARGKLDPARGGRIKRLLDVIEADCRDELEADRRRAA